MHEGCTSKLLGTGLEEERVGQDCGGGGGGAYLLSGVPGPSVASRERERGGERKREREEGRDPDDFHFPCQGDKN